METEQTQEVPLSSLLIPTDPDAKEKETEDETELDPMDKKDPPSKKAPATPALATNGGVVKRPRHNPSERRILLAKAVEDVKNQRISMRRAAQRYNLAKSSLCDYVRKQGIILPTVRYKNSQNSQNSNNNSNTNATSNANSANGNKFSNGMENKLPTQVPSVSNHFMGNLGAFNTSLFNSPPIGYKKMKLDEDVQQSSTPLPSLLSPFQLVTSNPNLSNLLLTSQAFPQNNNLNAFVNNSFQQPVTSQQPGGNSNTNNNILSSMLINLLNNQAIMNGNCGPLRPTFPNIQQQSGQFSIPSSQQHQGHNQQQKQLGQPLLVHGEGTDVNTLLMNLQQKMKDKRPETPEDHTSRMNESEVDSNRSTPPQTPTPQTQKNAHDSSTHNSTCSTPISHTPDADHRSQKTPTPLLNNNNKVKPPPLFCDKRQLLSSVQETCDNLNGPLNLFNPGTLFLNHNNNNSHGMNGPLVDTQATLAALLAQSNSSSVYHNGGQYQSNPFPNQPHSAQISQNNMNKRNCQNSDDILHIASANSTSNYLQNALLQNDNAQSTPFHLSSNQMINSVITPQQMQKAKELVQFINNSPTPFHVVKTVKDRLTSSGFRELKDTDPNWNVKPNDKFFVTKNGSTLFAIAVGALYKPDSGFSIFGAHTDSPCLRVKPNSKRVAHQTVQLGVETYGGGLWYTWLDRDLTLAGRCIVGGANNSITQKLVNLERPVACVPSLAIHLNREQNKSFAPSLENHLVPILCSEASDQLNSFASTNSYEDRHPSELVNAIASNVDCQAKDIIETELYLVDTQPATIGGINGEYVHAPRLDNQFNCFVGLEGLMSSLDNLGQDENVRVLCLYDHEEVGSTSCQGANSSFTANLLRRVHSSLNSSSCDHNNFCAAMGKSLLISADQAHAIHPSHPEKHERNHQPKLHSSAVVIKNNVNQRYTTNSLTSSIVRTLAAKENVELLNFVINQDTACGSTIGPMLSSQLGIASIDTGSAQVAMHSCRELAGVASITPAIDLYKSFFANLSSVMNSVHSEM